MADTVKCPTCGENNPSEFEFCQYCQSRLQPLTGPLKGADAPITPGSAPTKKSTADLEPVLPQWLRDARSSARDTSEGDLPQTPQPKTSPRPSASQDLLAGLRSQAEDDEEETPDWLANITGGTPSSKKSNDESSDVRWVELGGSKDSTSAADVPSWMQGLAPVEPQSDKQDGLTDWMREASGTPQQPAADSPDWLRQISTDDSGKSFDDSANTFMPADSSDTPDWLRQMGAADSGSQSNNAPEVPASTFNAAPASADTPDWLRSLDAADSNAQNNAASDTPDWLKSLDSQSNAAPAANAPDWLRSLDAADTSSQNNNALFDGSAPETPDWLNSLGTQSHAAPAASDTPDWLRSLDSQNDAAPAQSSASDTPDWLSSLGTQDNAAPAQSSASDTPDWLSSLGATDSGSGVQNAAVPAASDTPDWLKGLDAETPTAPVTTPTSSAEDDWLKGLQSGGSQPAQSDQLSEADVPAWLSAAPTPAAPTPEIKNDDAALGDVPSWLKAAAPQSSIYNDLPSAQPATPVESSDTPDWLNAFKSLDSAPPAQPEPSPAFDSASSLGGSTDALFTDMPDWLSGSVETPAPGPAPETSTTGEIEASQLPSWVQAMRPVDTGVAQISAASGDQTLEARGALAGLQGVLPAAPGYAPTSKPKAYSLRLQATDDQLSQAALLEQILAAETSPVPISSFSTLSSSRGLRWSLAFVFFAMTFAVLFLRTQIFSLPVGVPLEIDGALQMVQSIPDGAPVLVAFDYEPARVGEMEAAAAPVFVQLALLRHPRLTFISTNENSSILAERFIKTGPLAVDNYQSGVQYTNLGYLPGGQMGIRAFAQDPKTIARFDISLAEAWASAPLQGVNSFSNFAAFILITDSADSARAWIEQTTFERGSMPVMVISSAQSAPMIQPYYAAGQITGLVSGLYGGAIFEQNNAGLPGTARIYWDVYSIGMLIAAALIVFGGIWNLILSSRDHAAAREVK